MKIKSKIVTQSYSRMDMVSLFEFDSRKEFERFLASLRCCAMHLPEPKASKTLLSTAEKLEKRCDSKLSARSMPIESLLFSEEMTRFVMALVETMDAYADFSKLMDEMLDQLEDTTDDAD